MSANFFSKPNSPTLSSALIAAAAVFSGAWCAFVVVLTRRQQQPAGWRNFTTPAVSLALNLEELLAGPESYQRRVDPVLEEYVRTSGVLVPPVGDDDDRGYKLANPRALDSPAKHLAESSVIDTMLQQRRGGFFVECGAFDGETASNSLLFEVKRNWSGLLVEPIPEFIRAILGKKRKRSHLLKACLSVNKYAEKVTFVGDGLASGVGGIAKVDASPAIRSLREKAKGVLAERQCLPFGAVWAALGRPSPIHLFSLDVESAEEQMLKTFPWDKLDIWIFLIETANSDKQKIHDFMKSKNYVVAVDAVVRDSIYVRRDLVASGRVIVPDEAAIAKLPVVNSSAISSRARTKHKLKEGGQW